MEEEARSHRNVKISGTLSLLVKLKISFDFSTPSY